MDWDGQKVSEQLMQYLLLASALVALLSGYVAGSFRSMLHIYLAGVAVTFMLTVPDWPFFNRHPFTWAEPVSAQKPSARPQQDGTKSTT